MSASTLHSTAVVAADAHLGHGVEVGPYAVIEPGAVVADGVVIGPHVVIKGATTLGPGCRVHAGAVIGDDPQDLGFDVHRATRLEVGARSVLREHVTVHRSTDEAKPTRIGEDCLLMAHAHVAHDAALEDRVVLCNSALVAGHCHIGERAFLSGNTVVHQFCRVGTGVMLSGISGVNQDIGPWLMIAERSDVVALNRIGMKRSGMSSEARRRVLDAYLALFRASSLESGLAAIRELGDVHQPEVARILEFYAGSTRGYSRPAAGHPFLGSDPA